MTAPTFCTVPDGDESTGQDCVDLATGYGIGLDEWQCDIIRGIFREVDGEPVVSQAGITVARQSGKGQILCAVELFGLFELGEQILHTAHAVKTSSDAFRRLWSVIQAHEELAARVVRHSQMIGAEYVELDSGARISFTTRSASAGRGLSIDRLVVDEAEDLPAAEIAALQPTVYSRPRAQSMFFGTAPGPQHDSEAFSTMRDAAQAGSNPRLAWWEWCAEWGADIDDEAVWLATNPAVATGRVPIQAIRDDRAVLPADAFRAERLSMWLPKAVAEAMLFDAPTWQALCDPNSAPVTDLAIGLDVPPSRDAATVCLAGCRSDGVMHVEWYETREGVTWLPAWVSEHLNNLVRAVVVDDKSPLAELDWSAAGVRVTKAGSRDVAAAAGLFMDAVIDPEDTGETLRHCGQVELTKGVLAAKQRPIGLSFGWDRKAPGSSVLIAASLALWGVTCERPRMPQLSERQGRRAVVL